MNPVEIPEEVRAAAEAVQIGLDQYFQAHAKARWEEFQLRHNLDDAQMQMIIYGRFTRIDQLEIYDLGLSVRGRNVLGRYGITTVRQLVNCTEEDLLEMRNFGVRCLDEVIFGLDRYGLKLKEADYGLPRTEAIMGGNDHGPDNNHDAG